MWQLAEDETRHAHGAYFADGARLLTRRIDCPVAFWFELTGQSRAWQVRGMRKFALFAGHFTPSNLAAVHRARLWAQFLSEFGWQPTIVTTHHRHYEEQLDWWLSEQGKAEREAGRNRYREKVVRRPPLPERCRALAP